MFIDRSKQRKTNQRDQNQRGEGARLRERLVAAARDLLIEPQRLGLPSLRAVARASGVAPSAVYLHFASADDLLDAVIADQLASLRQALAATGPDASVLEKASAYLEWGLHNPGGYQLLFESADRIGTERVATPPPGWDLIEDIAAAIARETDGEPSEIVAVRLWTVMHGIVSLRLHKPDLDWPESAADAATRAVRDCLR